MRVDVRTRENVEAAEPERRDAPADLRIHFESHVVDLEDVLHA
jgi:hypothetical protein